MPNFGTYEGHRILSDAMSKTVDRASRRYEFDEQQRMQNARDRMDQEKFAEQRRQYNENMAQRQHEYEQTFGEGARRYDNTFGEGVRQFDTTFDEGTRRYDTTFDEGQRQFDENIDQRTWELKKKLKQDTYKFKKNLKQRGYEYDNTFDEGVRRYDQGYNEDVLRDRRNFGEDQFKDRRNFSESQIKDRRNFKEDSRRWDIGDDRATQNQEQKNWAFDVMRSDHRDTRAKKDLENQLMSNIRPDQYNFLTEDGLLKDPESIKQILSTPLDNAYIQDLEKLDVNGSLSLDDKSRMASNVTKQHSRRVFDEMVGQFKKAGMTQDQIAAHIEANGLTDHMDDFMIRGMGIKPNDVNEDSSPILKALYGTEYDNSRIESAGSYGVDSNRTLNSSRAKTEEKMIMKAMERFGKDNQRNSEWYKDDIDNINIEQDSDGNWSLEEVDMLGNDEFDIKFDRQGPYIVVDKENLYLNNPGDYDKLREAM